MDFLKDLIEINNLDYLKDLAKEKKLDQEKTEQFIQKYNKRNNRLFISCKQYKIDDYKDIIQKDHYNDGIVNYLGLKFENGDIKQCKTQKLRLIEPDHEELQVPDVEFSSIINLPSSDFQKIIRDLSPLSDKLEIKSLANELIFKCAGSFATAEIRRAESDGSLEFQLKPDNSKIIQGEFSLKNLN